MAVNKNGVEEGITNLGLIPKGVRFYDAVVAMRQKRKFVMNAYEGGHRLTICDTLRMTSREIDKFKDSPEKRVIKEYLNQAYDFGKRMDARMKYLKNILDEHGIEYEKGTASNPET